MFSFSFLSTKSFSGWLCSKWVKPGFALGNNSRVYKCSGEFCIGIPVKVGHSNFRLSGTPIVSISTCQTTKLAPTQTSGIMIVRVDLHYMQSMCAQDQIIVYYVYYDLLTAV